MSAVLGFWIMLPLEVLTNYKSEKSWNRSEPQEGARCPVLERGEAPLSCEAGTSPGRGRLCAVDVGWGHGEAPGAQLGVEGRPRTSRVWKAALHTRVNTAGGEKGCPRRSQLPDSQAERDRVPARGGRSLRRATCRPAGGSTRSWPLCSILGPRDHGKQSRGAGDGVTACWRRRPRFSRTESSLHVTHRFRDTKRFCRKLTMSTGITNIVTMRLNGRQCSRPGGREFPVASLCLRGGFVPPEGRGSTRAWRVRPSCKSLPTSPCLPGGRHRTVPGVCLARSCFLCPASPSVLCDPPQWMTPTAEERLGFAGASSRAGGGARAHKHGRLGPELRKLTTQTA